MLDIRMKRVYAEASPDDGLRILVDRVWPRGISKEAAEVSEWLREIAPSDDLRQWFGHEPSRWPEFRDRYWSQLDDTPEVVERLRGLARRGRLTLVYGAKEERYNNARALKEYLEGNSELR